MRYRLVEPLSWQEEIKKSKFIVHAAPVQNEAEAFAFFTLHSDQQATHNCWAFRIGQNYRFNDDGEPSGTAGKPILSAIDGQKCDEIAILIIRYFGGIKLGAGGLMRAYGGSASHCLQQEKAQLVPIVLRKIYAAYFTYSQWPIMENEIKNKQAIIESVVFAAVSVEIKLSLTDEQLIYFAPFIQNLTKGAVHLVLVTK